MVYTTTELITRAYYLSSVVGRDFETVTGEQLNDGLNMLNALLDIKTANSRLIPYFTTYNFTAVVNLENYFIPNLILAETLTFDIGTVRYSMELKSRREYFGTPRANNVDSLPYIYYCERTLNGTTLYMYYLPNQAYPFVLHGKFSLADVSLGQDLSLTLDQYYIEYLRYALAEYICQEYNITYQPQSQQRLKELEAIIFDISPIDFTTSKLSMLQQGPSLNYAQANIGRGWTVGGST